MNGYYCDAVTVDDQNRVIGYNYATYGGKTGFIAFMNDGNYHYLGTLGGTYSMAVSLNTAGKIVGESTDVGGHTHGFFYDGIIHDLQTLGGTYSSATWLNNSDDVCGVASIASGTQHGFIKTGGIMYDLNSLLDSSSAAWSITIATSMNDNGQIVGSGIDPISGQTHAVLLEPVPEPASLGVIALVGMLSLGRRPARQAAKQDFKGKA